MRHKVVRYKAMENHGNKVWWYKNGLRFQCQRCGNCCRSGPGYVWVSSKEIKGISLYLGLGEEEFGRKHIKKVGHSFSLRELSNWDCIMYKAKGCQIYPVRPRQCSTFPFWPRNLESYETWVALKKFCEGIDKGTLYTFSQIQKISLGHTSVDTCL